MRVGELSRQSGVGVSMIKYYLREGMLPAGERAGAPNQAEYGETHLRRLRLLRALTDDGGLSAAAIKQVLAVVDSGRPLHESLGIVQLAIADPSSVADLVRSRLGEGDAGEHVLGRDPPPGADGLPGSSSSPAHRAVADLAARRGWRVDPGNPGWQAAVAVLATAARLDADHLVALLDVYAEAVETIARREIDLFVDANDREGTVESVVTGIVLGEALISALRTMAHQDASARRLGVRWPPTPDGSDNQVY